MLKILYTRLNIDSLTPKERQKVEHDAAHALLEVGLASLGFPSLSVCYHESGKPYFEGDPIHFSLSHSKGVAVCALSDAPVGVDVEVIRLKKLESIKRITERTFNEHERQLLIESNYDLSVFYDIWVKKEAMVKRTGVGVRAMSQTDSSAKEVASVHKDTFVIAACSSHRGPLLLEEIPDTYPHK